MASNSKKAREKAEKGRRRLFDSYVNRFNSYFNNSVEVINPPVIFNGRTEEQLPKRYLLNTLREYGAIAYYPKIDMFLRFTKSGINANGLPLTYILYSYDGSIYDEVNANEICILRANDMEYNIEDYIEIQADKLVDIDMAIKQNLEGSKTMSIIKVPNEQSLLTFVNLAESRRVGSSVAYVSKNSGISSDDFEVCGTNVQYICDKLQELRTQIMRETLSNLGFSVSNEDKKERVQTSELTTLNTHGLDAINILVDTFNYDAKYYGLDIRLKANTELAIKDEQNQIKEGE